ncbi:MAG: hypothetical protein P1U89_00175 [Verrucomicrobiales bacterium]|nr:hypothetical protein [Verrucomicrobiales bacterium]
MALQRKSRRLLLLVVTLTTIISVLYGAVNFGVGFQGSPLSFVIYWATCFVGAMLLIVLAFIDMRLIRKEHRQRQTELDAELAKIVSDAEKLAAETMAENSD